MIKKFSFLVLVLAFLACVFATPLPKVVDNHSTSVDLYAVDESDYGRFLVRVERIDEIVDVKEDADAKTEEGTLLGARVADIIVMFDVSPKGDVSVNGVSVPMGMTNMQIEAEVVTGITADGEKLSEDQLTAAFDRGLVGLTVHVEGETASNGEVEVTRLIISELIQEINGQEVDQNQVMQQVVEIHPDGNIVRHKPCAAAPDSKAVQAMQGARHHGNRKACLGRKIAVYFQSLPIYAKVGFSVLLGAFLGLVASAIARIMTVIFRGPSATVYEVYGEDAPFIAKVAMEDEKLPVYTKDGYAKIETEDKQ